MNQIHRRADVGRTASLVYLVGGEEALAVLHGTADIGRTRSEAPDKEKEPPTAVSTPGDFRAAPGSSAPAAAAGPLAAPGAPWLIPPFVHCLAPAAGSFSPNHLPPPPSPPLPALPTPPSPPSVAPAGKASPSLRGGRGPPPAPANPTLEGRAGLVAVSGLSSDSCCAMRWCLVLSFCCFLKAALM